MTMRKTYTALAERGHAWWAITVPELRGVFTQARRLANVEPMARDAIALFLDIAPDSFDIEVRAVLDLEIDALVAEAIKARSDAVEHSRIAAAKSREAVAALDRLGLPQRDIGRLLNLSHQRVAQLLAPGGGPPRRGQHAEMVRAVVADDELLFSTGEEWTGDEANLVAT